MTTDLIPTPTTQVNPATVYIAGLTAEKSRRSQLSALQIIGQILTGEPTLDIHWHALRYEHTSAIRTRLAEIYAPATTNRILCALRGTLRAACKLGQMTRDDCETACSVASLAASTLPRGRALTPGEIHALVRACQDGTAAGHRDAAILACLYPGGLRRDEVTALNLDDYDQDTGALTIRQGKGNKDRTAYLTNGAQRALSDWLSARGDDPGALFYPIDQKDRLEARRMAGQAVYIAMHKRGKLANVHDFSPHDLRRTFISDLLDAGADISTVAQLAGHASVITTQRYDRRPEEAKRKAAGLLHLPY